jgi:hypothetical protein
MKNEELKMIEPLKADELGRLKGGFTLYKTTPEHFEKESVSVTVHGSCGCICNGSISENGSPQKA